MNSVLTSPDIPYNEGMARPIAIKVPYGSLLNPRPPAPVRARMIPAYRVFNAVMKALAQALPDQVIATGFDCTTAFCLSRLGEKGYSVYLEIFGGGYGGRAPPTAATPWTRRSQLLQLPGRIARHRLRFLPHRRLRAGARLLRPGRAARRRRLLTALRDPADDVQLAIYSDRFRLAPEGLWAANPASAATAASFAPRHHGGARSKAAIDLAKGDIVEMFVGGGAGFGRVAERPDS